MTIAIIISNTRDPNSGTASVSLNLAEKFRIRGKVCELIFKEDILQNMDGILKQILFALVLPFRKALTSHDVLDINVGDGFFVAFVFRRIKSLRHPLLIARSHGLEHVVHEMNLAEARSNKMKLSWKYPFYHGGYRLWQVKKYLQSADLAFFLNSYDRDYAVTRLGVDVSRAKIVDNGLPDMFIGRSFDPAIPRQIKIALIGTFIKRKGIEYSIPALNVLLEKNANLSVGFFGPKVPAEEILERFGPAVQDRVEVKEQYPHDGLPALLEPYRIFLFASLAEGFGLAALEAMACGLALVITDISGVAERLTHDVNAVIIPPRDQQAIQDAIQRLIDDHEFLVRIRNAGYILAQNFSWTRVANDTLLLYEEGMKRRSREVLKC